MDHQSPSASTEIQKLEMDQSPSASIGIRELETDQSPSTSIEIRKLEIDQSPLPRVFIADPRALLAARDSYSTGISDGKLNKPLKKLMKDAGKAMLANPPSVTDRKIAGPSSDPHDFLSFSPYRWLDTATNLYIRRDGERNPEADEDMDNGRFHDVCKRVSALALAFYVSGEEKFASKAGEFLRRFFINPATRMNPNLEFGHVIPRTTAGRMQGIISVRYIVDLVDALGMLEGSKSDWIATDLPLMKDWMSEFLAWLTTSEIGQAAGHAKNNHASFYDTVVASILFYLNRTESAREILSKAGTQRFGAQIQADGKQKHELKRTKSFTYSCFNLEALSKLAILGQNVGIDLWSYGKEEGNGRSLLEAALEFVAPYVNADSVWPLQQIASMEKPRKNLAKLLLRDAHHYPGNRVIAAALEIAKKENLTEKARERLLHIIPDNV